VAVHILVADLTDENGIRAVEETAQQHPVLIRWLTTPARRRWRRSSGEVAQHQAINTLNTTALMR
jgi:hypothetical protein